MNPKLEAMILEAREAIVQVGIATEQGGKVDTRFKGYIASLGPSLVSNGLLAAILIYEKESNQKQKVSRALRYLLTKETDLLSDFLLKKNGDSYPNLTYRTLCRIADYTLALKLALSLFNLMPIPPNATNYEDLTDSETV